MISIPTPLKLTSRNTRTPRTMKKMLMTLRKRKKMTMRAKKCKLFNNPRKRIKVNPKRKLKSLSANNNDCQYFIKSDLLYYIK